MEDQHIQSVPLWKQLMGAVIGGGLALALYYGYEYAKPKVTAYLTIPGTHDMRTYDLGASNIADKTTDEGNRKRILSRNVRTAARLQGNEQVHRAALESVDDHSLDIAWPGHEKQQANYVEPEVQDVAEQEVEDSQQMQRDSVLEQRILEQELATFNMEPKPNAWENLMGDIADKERTPVENDYRDADGLTDTGPSLVVLAFGALGGALGARKKKAVSK